jgi:hypothetical protein
MIEKSWLSTLKPILQSFSDSQNKIVFAIQGNVEVRASKKLVKYFANLIRNYYKINSNTTTNITCRKSRNYQQSSWSVFDQAKTLSFSAVIKWFSAVL